MLRYRECVNQSLSFNHGPDKVARSRSKSNTLLIVLVPVFRQITITEVGVLVDFFKLVVCVNGKKFI